MKDYKENIYDRYYTSHTQQLYGDKTIDKIKSQFPVYEYYFSKHLPTDKNVSIIDLGCGSGEFVYWLKEINFKNVKGIDFSKELIEIGLLLGIENIQCHDIFDFLTENKTAFHTIIMRDVLEHFEKDETYKLVKLLYDNLLENGKIILQVPNGQSPFVGKILYGDFTHHNAFTESSIQQLFKSVGFKQVKVFEVTPIPKNFKGIFRFFLWKLLRLFLKLCQMIATGEGVGYYSPNIIAVIRK